VINEEKSAMLTFYIFFGAGILLAIIGFCLAFRQDFIRRLWRCRPRGRANVFVEPEDDPVRYFLRILGVMVMAFGLAIAGFEFVLNSSSRPAPPSHSL
jgi:hypothetical protein